MPLDMGPSTSVMRLVDTTGRSDGPAPTHYDTLGAYLKAVREHRELSLADLAKETRVRRAYLLAIEGGDRAALPSRPFAIGYVRSYARALGLDGELAVNRLKGEWPDAVESLRNPSGVAAEGRGARTALCALAGVLVVAIGLWNVAQRTLIRDEPHALDLPAAIATAPYEATAPIRLAPLSEAPAESTTPTPYVTPGLEAVAPVPATPAASAIQPAAIGRFFSKGEMFGAPPTGATVVLQALQPVSLVVHGPDGAVYFARMLKSGQAYRAPLGRGLTAALSDPTAVDVFIAGRRAPAITAEPVAVDKLEAPAVAPNSPPAVVASPPSPAYAKASAMESPPH